MMYTKEWWKAVLNRALITFCESALGIISIDGAVIGIADIDWLRLLSVSAVATLASVLRSIKFGVPEVKE